MSVSVNVYMQECVRVCVRVCWQLSLKEKWSLKPVEHWSVVSMHGYRGMILLILKFNQLTIFAMHISCQTDSYRALSKLHNPFLFNIKLTFRTQHQIRCS